jgi:glutathione S-transferase
MSLKLYYHPLSSYCWKVLLALYENETPFEPVFIDLANETSRAELLKLWPVGKFPVLRDEARDRTVPESSIIIEYLGLHYPGRLALLPDEADRALQVRLQDRFIDLHLHDPMQRIVGDRLRPESARDAYGVERERARALTGLDLLERQIADRTWIAGEDFSLADCAAAPALYYLNRLRLIGDAHRRTKAYLHRFMQRPSFSRVLHEAEPYFGMFPL